MSSSPGTDPSRQAYGQLQEQESRCSSIREKISALDEDDPFYRENFAKLIETHTTLLRSYTDFIRGLDPQQTSDVWGRFSHRYVCHIGILSPLKLLFYTTKFEEPTMSFLRAGYLPTSWFLDTADPRDFEACSFERATSERASRIVWLIAHLLTWVCANAEALASLDPHWIQYLGEVRKHFDFQTRGWVAWREYMEKLQGYACCIW